MKITRHGFRWTLFWLAYFALMGYVFTRMFPGEVLK